MRTMVGLVLIACMCTFAQADYKYGKAYRVKNDVMDFEVVELLIDGKFAAYVEKEVSPILFSERYYVYAACPTDKTTRRPDGYCLDWQVYDLVQKKSRPLALRGLGFNSLPSFQWPYIAYVQVPDKTSLADMQKNAIEVSCNVIVWQTKSVVAKTTAMVSPGYFEGDTPWSFVAPVFARDQSGQRVTCSEYQGKVIATVRLRN